MSFEDCIDVVRDWVIAQAYATIAYVDAEIAALKAWVEAKLYLPKADLPEYMISASVTGDIDPDARCRYFRAGDYNGQPYYKRPDGSWFIWWDGDATWYISGTLGSLAPPYWARVDPDIEGTYPINFLSTGDPVVTLGSKYLINAFIDRGDPAAVDFALGDLTRDGAYHDLNLSGIVPAGAKGVCLSVLAVNAFVNKFAYFRTKSNANDFNISILAIQVTLVLDGADLTVPLPSTRIIEYNLDAVGWVFFTITVKGWWF